MLLISTATALAVAGAGVAAYVVAGSDPAKTTAADGRAAALSDPAVGHGSLGQDLTVPTASTSASNAAPPASPTSETAAKPPQSAAKPTARPARTSDRSTASKPGGGPVVPVPVPPGWSGTGTDDGPLLGSTAMTVTFSLQSRDPQGLRSFVAAVSDPSSPSYRRFLSNADYATRFGPDPAVRDELAGYLAAAGLKVAVRAQDFVSVAGTADQVQKALRVSLHNYKAGGDVRYAPTGPITLPSDVSAAIVTVKGLDDSPSTAKPTSYGRKPNAATGIPNCTQGYGTDSGWPKVNGSQVDWAPCPYNFQQIRHAYGADATAFDGRGVTVGVVDVYNPPTLYNDASTYARTHGWPGFFPLQFTVVDDPNTGYQGDCNRASWYGEAAMDIQAVHAIAPGANVVYGAAGCAPGGQDNLYGMLDWFVANHLADFVTNSWSSLEAAVTPQEKADFDLVARQAAAKGIGLSFSTGDCTDENNSCSADKRPPCDAQTQAYCAIAVDVDFPASDENVTAVGGTSMALDAQGNRLFDAPWADTVYAPDAQNAWVVVPPAQPNSHLGTGSGGGVSKLADRPPYQPGTNPKRMLPDISLDASPYTGMEFGEHVNAQGDADPNGAYKEVTSGGTSLASPLFAGLQALVQQRVGQPIGFANPRLYQLAGSAAITDVVQAAQNGQPMMIGYPGVPDNVVSSETFGAQTCGTSGTAVDCKGFDLNTGLGTPSTSYINAY